MKLNLTTEGDKYTFLTVQGEGKYTGVLTTFCRLNFCNLNCVWKNPDGSLTYCDTPHSSWESHKENLVAEIDDIIAEVNAKGARHVVVTGGEPMMQSNVDQLITQLAETDHLVTIETNGTIFRQITPGSATRNIFFSISPKLSTSTNPLSPQHIRHESKRYNLESLRNIMKSYDYQFKFVVNTEEDIKEIIDLYINPLNIPNDKVYLMPQGITNEQLNARAPWIIEKCKEYKWNFSHRMHIVIYGNKKGI